MFYVPSLGIYTHLSTPVPIFINRIQHFWVITNLVSSVCYAFPELVFCIISTSYTKSFVWSQKLKSKGVKSRDRVRHRIGTRTQM
jgi:hypothetical protein